MEQIKNEMYGVRWWVEGDIKGFFDNVSHDSLITILSKRITDKRFLHLIGQILKAGYVEDWRYHQTNSGVPQGGNLSPLLSNLYLNERDQTMARKIAEFNRGTDRKRTKEKYFHTKGDRNWVFTGEVLRPDGSFQPCWLFSAGFYEFRRQLCSDAGLGTSRRPSRVQ